ncbi:helix-turn-helix domain-containing protein [Breoghania sp.]|uniref:helix-turn-helix domain-containing protein n=1 Tax=Breoghania sp. TaxID=2065378 RepID=UPI0026272753|nr:helix-turn-helix domain-containing protein [Breoghania sp.]MDJ0931010.1 helix-turn-helix domain-containing protein [Breoghania sp.]
MTKRKTITDLARKAQVSISTIDRILNGRNPVKQATVEHVLEAAERIGFYAVSTIRDRLGSGIPEKTFGFLLNSKKR